MKKRIIVLFLIGVIGISSAFSESGFFSPPTGDEQNVTNVSAAFVQTLSKTVNASSIGGGVFYQFRGDQELRNKTSFEGLYINFVVAKPLAFSYDGLSAPTKTVAISLQHGIYDIVQIDSNMFVKYGGGINYNHLGAEESGNKYSQGSFGLNALGAFEYELIEGINLVATLTLGLDFFTRINENGVKSNPGGVVFTIMPAVGASYLF